MSVTKNGERKLVFFTFTVEGTHASISAVKVNADGSHGDVVEKKEQVNHKRADGTAVGFVTFPEGYEGEAFIEVQGSAPGTLPDSGVIAA